MLADSFARSAESSIPQMPGGMFSAFRQLINELPMQHAFHTMQVGGTRPRPREKGTWDEGRGTLGKGRDAR